MLIFHRKNLYYRPPSSLLASLQEEASASADTIYQGHLAEHVDAATDLQAGAEDLMAQGEMRWDGFSMFFPPQKTGFSGDF